MKENKSEETFQDLYEEYDIGRHYPAILLKQFQDTGDISSNPLSGGPSKVKDFNLRKEMEELIRVDRRGNSTCRRLERQSHYSYDVANRMSKDMKMKMCRIIARPSLSTQNI